MKAEMARLCWGTGSGRLGECKHKEVRKSHWARPWRRSSRSGWMERLDVIP